VASGLNEVEEFEEFVGTAMQVGQSVEDTLACSGGRTKTMLWMLKATVSVARVKSNGSLGVAVVTQVVHSSIVI
jgi:hypothetical protein